MMIMRWCNLQTNEHDQCIRSFANIIALSVASWSWQICWSISVPHGATQCNEAEECHAWWYDVRGIDSFILQYYIYIYIYDSCVPIWNENDRWIWTILLWKQTMKSSAWKVYFHSCVLNKSNEVIWSLQNYKFLTKPNNWQHECFWINLIYNIYSH